jgi:DNA-binding beta-propeller fold protein YncE
MKLPGVNDGELSVSTDGARLFVLRGSGGKGASIIDLATNKVRTNLRPMIASADGTRIAIAHERTTYRADIRTVDGDKLLGTHEVPGFVGMQLSHDGSLLVVDAGGKGKTIEVVDIATAKTVYSASCQTTYNPHVALTPDNRLLACITSKAVEVHDLRAKKRVKEIPYVGSVDAIALSADGKRLAYALGHIVIVDL